MSALAKLEATCRVGGAPRLIAALVMEELVKFTLLTRDVAPSLVDRYRERKESVEALSKRVNQRSL